MYCLSLRTDLHESKDKVSSLKFRGLKNWGPMWIIGFALLIIHLKFQTSIDKLIFVGPVIISIQASILVTWVIHTNGIFGLLEALIELTKSKCIIVPVDNSLGNISDHCFHHGYYDNYNDCYKNLHHFTCKNYSQISLHQQAYYIANRSRVSWKNSSSHQS